MSDLNLNEHPAVVAGADRQLVAQYEALVQQITALQFGDTGVGMMLPAWREALRTLIAGLKEDTADPRTKDWIRRARMLAHDEAVRLTNRDHIMPTMARGQERR